MSHFLNSQQRYYLSAMGIQAWFLRDSPELESDKSQSASLKTLAEQVSHCQACKLAGTRTQTVFGVGAENAKLMFVGEAPGYYEDKQGEPFVGKAGQLLNRMLLAIGFRREEVYIANVLKCRPPNNRDPVTTEVAQCTPFLQQQIELIQPILLVALGRHAAHYLLNTEASLSRLRSQVHLHASTNTPLIVTYHPAYLLRNPSDKAKAYVDLLMIKRKMEHLAPH